MKLHQQRTCIGCRTVTGKNELLRWVLVEGASPRVVGLDRQGSAPGRGTWTHGIEKCVQQAVQRKAFARTFRSAVDDSQVLQQFTAHEDQLAASQLSGKHDESGSEI